VDLRWRPGRHSTGSWEVAGRLLGNTLPTWVISWRDLSFRVRPASGKQLGLFPEQAVNWEYVSSRVRRILRNRQPDLARERNRAVTVLNLFAYTGGATLALASAGAAVCHVDASKSAVRWAQDNLALSGLGDREVRFIVDDARKFLAREARRGRTYDGIVLDPPTFGHGPGGERWHLEDDLSELLASCETVLSPFPLFVVLNVHTTGIGPDDVKEHLLTAFRPRGGHVTVESIGLKARTGRVIPCGVLGRWCPT
jgi:23S rRNA (cytosine1962-C5)-methyltransferase